MKAKLISQTEAARLISGERATIRYWEQKGWLVVAKAVAPNGKAGRPAKLYRQADVERVARERGRGRR